jgi:hypothetical protein
MENCQNTYSSEANIFLASRKISSGYDILSSTLTNITKFNLSHIVLNKPSNNSTPHTMRSTISVDFNCVP